MSVPLDVFAVRSISSHPLAKPFPNICYSSHTKAQGIELLQIPATRRSIHPSKAVHGRRFQVPILDGNAVLLLYFLDYLQGWIVTIVHDASVDDAFHRLADDAQWHHEPFLRCLEHYFHEVLKESGRYTRLGYWHDRKGENEIDIIVEDEVDNKMEFIEVKRQSKNFDEEVLIGKSESFMKAVGSFNGYEIINRGLSIEDM